MTGESAGTLCPGETQEPCAAFRRERSRYGLGLSELKSALQKYIRRGETEKALWCAGELLSFRAAPEPDGRGRIQTNFRHRLMVILLEDVGDVGMWASCDAAVSGSRSFDALAVHGLVWRLAAATKARVCSHARAVAAIRTAAGVAARAMAGRHYPGIASLYGEYAADPRRGRHREGEWREALAEALRARSQTAVFWAHAIATEGAPRQASGGRKPVWQVFDVLEAATPPQVAALIPLARRWHRDLQSLPEAYLCWMLPLLAHVHGHPFGRNPDAGWVAPRGDPFPPAGRLELDPYVFDIHTSRGGSGGASSVSPKRVAGSKTKTLWSSRSGAPSTKTASG